MDPFTGGRPDLVGPTRRYLDFYRPTLLNGSKTPRLWITKDGRAFSTPGFTGQLAKLTRREFGEALRPHAFRHIAATTIATEDPEHANIIASVLGHSSLATSEKHYNRARSIEAVAAWQDVLRGMRQEAARQERRRQSLNRARRSGPIPPVAGD